MVIDGLEAIANGENPRNIEMRLEGLRSLRGRGNERKEDEEMKRKECRDRARGERQPSALLPHLRTALQHRLQR